MARIMVCSSQVTATFWNGANVVGNSAGVNFRPTS